jgi:hypothetical protein
MMLIKTWTQYSGTTDSEKEGISWLGTSILLGMPSKLHGFHFQVLSQHEINDFMTCAIKTLTNLSLLCSSIRCAILSTLCKN